MSRTTVLTSGLAIALILAADVADPPAANLHRYADAFLESLDPDERDLALLDFDSPERVAWHFIPKDSRKGLPLKDMNDAQRTAALRLLRAALSEAGYDKAYKITLLEAVNAELEGEDRRWARDPDAYHVTLFDRPSSEGAWGLSFEGHHLSLNFVCRDGEVVDSTPQFLGTNPATLTKAVEDTFAVGTRLLREEEELGFRLVNSLSPRQRSTAVIAAEAPADLRFAGEAQPKIGSPEGIAMSKLNPNQADLLMELIHTYTDFVAEPIAKRRRGSVDEVKPDDIHFAWAGATEPGIGHYYRVTGKRFLIEFVNTQPDSLGNPANHVHCNFRDLTGDFDLPIAP